jgi:hypothetical protein
MCKLRSQQPCPFFAEGEFDLQCLLVGKTLRVVGINIVYNRDGERR